MAPPLESTPTEVITAAASEPIWTDAAEPSSSLIDTISTSPPLGSSPIADAVVAPLQYGDLSALGLLSYTPAGLVRYSLEIINVATGLPWFWTIVAGTAFWRLLLFPATIRSTRNSSLMAAHGPELKAASEEFKAAVAFSPIPEERAAAMNKLMQTYTKAGVNPRTMMLTPFLQLPVVFGVFLGVKGMCELPLEQMKFSGVEWMPDLTVLTSVADPWFMLPALAVVGMNLQMKVSALWWLSFRGILSDLVAGGPRSRPEQARSPTHVQRVARPWALRRDIHELAPRRRHGLHANYGWYHPPDFRCPPAPPHPCLL